MKYNEMYPRVDASTFADDSRGLMASPTPSGCAVCKEESLFIDVFFETHVCSEECHHALNSDFEQHLAHMHRVHMMEDPDFE